MTTTLTERDLDLLQTLALRVRVLTVPQIAEVWWPKRNSLQPVRRRLERLTWNGFLRMVLINAHPLLRIQQPLAAWSPGEEGPDVEFLSDLCCQRWNLAAQPITVCVATALTGNLMGCKAGKLPSTDHIDRDLRLASVYCRWRTHERSLAQHWIGRRELPLALASPCSPDAFLRRSDGRLTRAIDAAGRWSAAQLQRFHNYCEDARLPYEVW